MYSENTRRRAFELYSIHRSILKVVNQLSMEIPEAENIDRKTVANWRREDEWDSRAREVRGRYFEDRDKEIAERLEEYGIEIDDTIDRLFMKLKDLEPKSFSEAVYTMITLLDKQKKMRGEVGETDKEEVIARVFKALNGLEWFAFAMKEGDNRRGALAAIEAEFGN